MTEAERLARQFHHAYESFAPNFGYETRPETRTFDPASVNGRLMIAVCEAVMPAELRRLAAEVEALRDALHCISLASQDSSSTREGMGLYARAKLAAMKEQKHG